MILFNKAIAMKCQKQSSRCSVKSYPENFRKIHKKTPVLESLYNVRLQRLQRRCFPVNFAKFKFAEHLVTVASEALHD